MRLQPLLCAALLLVLPAAARAQGEIKPYTASPIEPYKAKPIEPAKPDTVRPATGTIITGVKDLPAPIQPLATRPADLKAFAGTWRLFVEGASYTTDDYATNTRTVTTSSGAKGRRLIIRRNGTYDWGGTRGRWVATGEGANGYPLKLLHADHGHDWKIGWDTRRNAPAGRILVWDGYVWEVGTRR